MTLRAGDHQSTCPVPFGVLRLPFPQSSAFLRHLMVVRGQSEERGNRRWRRKSSLGVSPTFSLSTLPTPYQAGVFVPSPYPCKQASSQASAGSGTCPMLWQGRWEIHAHWRGLAMWYLHPEWQLRILNSPLWVPQQTFWLYLTNGLKINASFESLLMSLHQI